jgi:hypothetical protein
VRYAIVTVGTREVDVARQKEGVKTPQEAQVAGRKKEAAFDLCAKAIEEYALKHGHFHCIVSRAVGDGMAVTAFFDGPSTILLGYKAPTSTLADVELAEKVRELRRKYGLRGYFTAWRVEIPSIRHPPIMSHMIHHVRRRIEKGL